MFQHEMKSLLTNSQNETEITNFEYPSYKTQSLFKFTNATS